ncbi:hypothetical protein WMY93_033715, partial [Mugilogobius chulae]
ARKETSALDYELWIYTLKRESEKIKQVGYWSILFSLALKIITMDSSRDKGLYAYESSAVTGSSNDRPRVMTAAQDRANRPAHLRDRFSLHQVLRLEMDVGYDKVLNCVNIELNKLKMNMRSDRWRHTPGHQPMRRLSHVRTSSKDKHREESQSERVDKGVAGVGKTVLTQEFSLDWAEGETNQELQLLFPFTFRELNVLTDKFSLVQLLHHFFSSSKDLCSFQQLQVLFIFDGLDECRLPLDFSRTRVLTDPTESVSVDVLLVNLIRGSLLPSALLWITTRPAAANQIPAECVSMVTEVRGFTDLQKEQYFSKRFTDQAETVISHIKSVRSLYIMSHIPVFCWILSTVLKKLLEQTEEPELPRTLTQMYVHFLVLQLKQKNIKYDEKQEPDSAWSEENKKMVLSLSKLAFEQLQKGNLIFYESDLSECGLDAEEAARYSGVLTQVFREEPGLYQDKVYCFIHLSLQEFLAALHVHQTFYSSGLNLMETPQSEEQEQSDYYSDSEDGSSDSSESPEPTRENSLKKTKKTKRKDITPNSPESAVSFYVSAVTRPYRVQTDTWTSQRPSLVKEMQEYMRYEDISNRDMSPAQWSALSFILLSSYSDLQEFDLRKYKPSEEALLGLLPVVKASTKALLSGCGLSPHSCGPLASVLSSSSLTHLDLSHNELQDSGVELLCEGLKSAPCRLETLRLSGCLVSERGGAALASALSSAHSRVTELDLSYNHPGPSAELLTALQRPLQSVRLVPAGEQFLVPGLRNRNTNYPYLQLSHRKTHFSNLCRPSSSLSWQVQRVLLIVMSGAACPPHCNRSRPSSSLYWQVQRVLLTVTGPDRPPHCTGRCSESSSLYCRCSESSSL